MKWSERRLATYLANTIFGLFLIDKESKILDSILFYPDSGRAAEFFQSIESEDMSSELSDILQKVSSATIIVQNPEIGGLIRSNTDIEVSVDPTSDPITWFRTSIHNSALLERNKIESQDALKRFRREVAINTSRLRIIAATSERDVAIKNTIDAIDEIDKSINLLAMRLSDWYATYDPLLPTVVDEHEVFAQILLEMSEGALDKKALSRYNVDQSKLHGMDDSVLQGLRTTMPPDDAEAIRALAKAVASLMSTRSELEEHVTDLMSEIAPNLSALAGPLIGARLISLAGSLETLARKPSSTVQVYGAEKALFRSLRTGTDPPKHGIIFQVPSINNAPYWQRGKIARALAGKLAIAAKVDAYSDRDIGESLKTQFEERVEEIRRQHPESPEISPKPRHQGSSEKKSKRRGRKKGGR
jgi:nucleolar protein 56